MYLLWVRNEVLEYLRQKKRSRKSIDGQTINTRQSWKKTEVINLGLKLSNLESTHSLSYYRSSLSPSH